MHSLETFSLVTFEGNAMKWVPTLEGYRDRVSLCGGAPLCRRGGAEPRSPSLPSWREGIECPFRKWVLQSLWPCLMTGSSLHGESHLVQAPLKGPQHPGRLRHGACPLNHFCKTLGVGVLPGIHRETLVDFPPTFSWGRELIFSIGRKDLRWESKVRIFHVSLDISFLTFISL